MVSSSATQDECVKLKGVTWGDLGGRPAEKAETPNDGPAKAESKNLRRGGGKSCAGVGSRRMGSACWRSTPPPHHKICVFFVFVRFAVFYWHIQRKAEMLTI